MFDNARCQNDRISNTSAGLTPTPTFEASLGIAESCRDVLAHSPDMSWVCRRTRSDLVCPQTEGRVLVQSADPTAALLIDPNWLDREEDRAGLVAGTRAIRKIMGQKAFEPMVEGETKLTSLAQTDSEIIELARSLGLSGYHAVGTAAMGANEEAVLDHRLRVRGVAGLRVVDCSIFPEIPSGNTNAPTMAAGLYAADMILADARG